MKYIIPLLFTFTISNCLFAQTKWAERFGGPSFEEGLDIDSDINGNVYSVGYFSGFANITGQYYGSNGLYDGYVIKNNADGTVDFVKKIGGASNDKCLSIDVSVDGEFAITGFFGESMTIDGVTITAVGDQDVFVAKFTSSGNLIWLKSFGGTSTEQGNAVHLDNGGNVVITGEFSAECDFGGGNILQAVNNSIDVFILKLDAQGQTSWVKKGSGSATDRGVDIDVDDNGGIYVCGEFSDTVTFDIVHNNQMYNAMFLMKYSSNGQEQWFRHMGSGSQLNAGSLVVKNNNLYFTGDFDGTLYFIINKDPSNSLAGIYENCMFLAKYDLSGNIVWKLANSSENDIRSGRVIADNNGKIYVAGDFQCQFSEYADEYGTGVFFSLGSWDNFISEYDTGGQRIRSRQYGGKYTDYVYGICSKGTELVTTGSFMREYLMTVVPSQFLSIGTPGLDFNQYYGGGFYCGDSDYYNYISLTGADQNNGLHSDAFINACINLDRQPMDFFVRSGNNCNRDFIEPELWYYGASNAVGDTSDICGTPGYFVNNHDIGWWLQPNSITTWSNGSVNWDTYIYQTGELSVNYTIPDGCYSWNDSTYLIYNPVPDVPLISDNLGFNNSNYYTNWVHECIGDTVQLWSSNYTANQVQWFLNSVPINPNLVTITGTYECKKTNPVTGCSTSNYVYVLFSDTLNPVVPKIEFLYNGTPVQSDTISMCLGETFRVLFYDSLTNPTADINGCFPDLTSVQWLSNDSLAPILQTNCSAWNIKPLFAGNYIADFSVELTRYNPCETPTIPLHKRIVFQILSIENHTWDFEILPQVPLCPGAPAYFSLSDSSLSTRWEFCPDCWSWQDSAYYPDAGGHHVYVVDSILSDFGCTFIVDTMIWFEVSEYPQLIISTVPMNAIICPFDSVLISANTNLIQNWIGPDGAMVSTPTNFYSQTPGNYYAIADYGPDCMVVSNTIELIQYNTPYLLASPYGVICNGNPVTLTVQTTDGSEVTWLPPLSGNALSQTITDIGTYSCSIDVCDVYTEISMDIIIDSMNLGISTNHPDLQFCSTDSILLAAPTNLASYHWQSPLSSEASQLYVNEPGTYVLIASSGSGCTDTTQISVDIYDEYPNLEVMEDTSICAKYSASLHANSSDLVFWSNENVYNNAFAMGTSLETPLLYNTTTYYVYASTQHCTTEIFPITINVDPHCREIEIPNIITPNEDGHNDCFPNDEYDYDLETSIYDRWGNLVFHDEHVKGGWTGVNQKGKKVDHGTYFYILKATFYDGYEAIYKGNVMVVSDKK